MPKRTDINSILIIGAGPIIIGQACEFDYSGTQACKALKEEGYRVILVNSNPATIMTDPQIADATYIEPITVKFVEKIIKKEQPDAILPTVGGQTALNCVMDLANEGILDKYNIKLIGAQISAIRKAEDRYLFQKAMDKIELKTPRNAIVRSLEQALTSVSEIGLPAIIRPSFTLGGTGGGIANTMEEFEEIVTRGLMISPTHEVLIDQSVLGWKEYEMEVVRDKNDNSIIICSIENVDPMGIHTGDSITVAPALTLTDKEYQKMRNASIAVLREIGVETGGSNVQFAVNPDNGELLVIEMNPRVSRSSALASKATGFPIAKVATKLAVGYTLDEIKNDITGGVTPASFEPSIDYVVTKIPRFTFEKFKDSEAILSSAMKSVGEAMSIGRNFCESLQKALRSMETGLSGLDEVVIEGGGKRKSLIVEKLKRFSHNRLLIIAQAMREGFSVDEVAEITKYDRWYLEQVRKLIDIEAKITKDGLPNDKFGLHYLKKMGFSDKRLAILSGKTEDEVRELRYKLEIHPVYKRVDSCAGEFEASTAYMYSTYEGDGIHKTECESSPTDKKKIVILGGGPNRIGQGIEFDYTCCHASFTLKEEGYETIMVNCNPETVSTDYDTSDRLYFEPLTSEDVVELIRKEQQNGEILGVNVQFGGQTPLKLSKALEKAGIPILGTSPDMIDLAEDRNRFKKLVQNLNLFQPENRIGYSEKEVREQIQEINYPVVVRPSYVLGGRGMAIIYDEIYLNKYLKENEKVFETGPLLLDKFLTDAIEIDVDALSDQEDVYIAGIMEHIEEAGIHSGDSSCSLPPFSINKKMLETIREATVKLALALKVKGLMNVQYAIKGDILYILEVNPRASRTVPFVAKATGVPIAKIASLLMIGKKLREVI